MTTRTELTAIMRQVLDEHEHGALGGRDLAEALAGAALAALSTPQEAKWEHGVIGGEDLLARLMDTLAYYHCRSVNPKADSPHLGYHAMSEDQREFLRERQREAAEEVLRMWQSELGWEYRVMLKNGTELARGTLDEVRRFKTIDIERRRKAGPWEPLPVGGEKP